MYRELTFVMQFAHLATETFYNGVSQAYSTLTLIQKAKQILQTKGKDIMGPEANHNCSIHHWANHGIAGRGVLLDYWGYAKANGIEYDPYTSYAITFDELYKCGKAQGIDIRPESQGGDIKVADILMVRSGFVDTYHSRTPEERTEMALRPHAIGEADQQKYAGLAQEDAILDWLHDSYFSAVVGDAPAFERWPTPKEYYLHEYILALWGMPLGEMWDLERLAAKCRETNRWFFFMTSAPANVPGKSLLDIPVGNLVTDYHGYSWCQLTRKRHCNLLRETRLIPHIT